MKRILALALALVFTNSEAFTLNNSAKLTFGKDEVLVNIAGGFCTNIGITDTEFLSLASEAVDRFWNTAPTARLKLRKGSVVNVSNDFYNDPICVASTNCTPNPTLAVSSDILISCNANATNFPSGGILGVTIPNNLSGTKIIGSLVLINDTVATQFAGKTRDQKIAILAHELGHTFGLGHSPVTDSLMYFATVQSRLRLGQDDIDGITYLYPKKQPFNSCGTISTDLGNKNKPNWWSGLFIGFSIIAAIEMINGKRRKKRSWV